jgi:hypothetical protein
MLYCGNTFYMVQLASVAFLSILYQKKKKCVMLGHVCPFVCDLVSVSKLLDRVFYFILHGRLSLKVVSHIGTLQSLLYVAS